MQSIAYLLVASLLLGAASAQGNAISEGIRHFLEQFRLDMQCPFPQHDLPVLAPLRVPHWPIDVTLNGLAAQGDMLNVFVPDLDTFVVRSVDFNMVFMRMDFHFHYAQLRASGNFANTVGRSPGNCNVFGNGAFNVRAVNVELRMSTRLMLRRGTLVVDTISSTVSFGSFESNIQHFVGTLAQSIECNRLLSNQMPFIVSSSQSQISRHLDQELRPLANAFVDGKTLQDLLDIIARRNPPTPCH